MTLFLWILNILYVLIALAMIGLILMQRGAGAAAGSGFGGGASATVFGARGSANFLSKSTKWLAIAFFGITLGMAWMHMQAARQSHTGTSLGVMAEAEPAAATPAIPSAAPAAPATPAAAEGAEAAAPKAEAAAPAPAPGASPTNADTAKN